MYVRFPLSQRQGKPDIHHHRKPDDRGRTVEIAEGILHRCKLWNTKSRLKLICSDTACASVRSPLMAASATFALKLGVWFRRGRLLMVSPDSMGTACPLSGRNSTYRPVQISGTGSLRHLSANLPKSAAASIVTGRGMLIADGKSGQSGRGAA